MALSIDVLEPRHSVNKSYESIIKTIVHVISYRSYYCTVTLWPDKRCLSHGMCLYQVIMTLLFWNNVVNDTESTRKSIITS